MYDPRLGPLRQAVYARRPVSLHACVEGRADERQVAPLYRAALNDFLKIVSDSKNQRIWIFGRLLVQTHEFVREAFGHSNLALPGCLRVECDNGDDSLNRINICPPQLEHLALAHSCVDRTNQHWSNAFTFLAARREQALFFLSRRLV